MNLIKTSIVLVLGIFPFIVFGQGKIMMVGGGAEGSWSDPAYSWGVEQASNKKVGIVSYYSDETQDLPKYFMQLGADTAVNIGIGKKSLADTDSIYNVLISYDFLFFKGGDQSNYYETYQSTKVTQAIMDKFNEGGVIGGTSAGMAILSGVMYTALKSSSYPDDALNNFQHSDITLSNDFINILPGYICDTHFIERGRPFRLWAFMARWFADENELLTGIGVDDKTAFCIDENKIGTAIGTAAVSIYSPSGISLSENQFRFDNLTATHLLDSHRYDLNTKLLLSDMPENTKAKESEEKGNYGLLLSGGESLAHQTAMIDHLISNIGMQTDTIIVVSSTLGKARTMIDQISLLSKETTALPLITTSSYNQEDSARIRNIIRRSKKFVFYENTNQALFDFLEGGKTGELLQSHLKRNNIYSAFCGQDARYAGASFTTNHTSNDLASYRHQLNYEDGLGLLSTSIIMPNTLDKSSTDFYENTTSAVTYGMAENQLRYGLYLNAGQFISIAPQNDQVLLTQYGSYPAVLVSNLSENGELSTGRNVIAADKIKYDILLDQDEVPLGTAIPSEEQSYLFEELPDEPKEVLFTQDNSSRIKIYPNPTSGVIILPSQEDIIFEITDSTGKSVLKGVAQKTIDLSNLQSGVYFIILKDSKSAYNFKFIKE